MDFTQAPPPPPTPPAWPTPPAPFGAPYPVGLELTNVREQSQWWGIPILGWFVRSILLIPHFIFLFFLALLAAIWLGLFGWIPILFLGRVPGFQAAMIKELLHRGSRVGAYLYLLPGYPPLGIGAPGPTNVTFDLAGRPIHRLWGIPFFGWLARIVVLIPHFIVLSVLNLAVGLTALLVWIPILMWGRVPELAARIFDAGFRYSVRVGAYALMLPIPYPPFTLD
jgi:hypothetical protein